MISIISFIFRLIIGVPVWTIYGAMLGIMNIVKPEQTEKLLIETIKKVKQWN